jgi:predicted outer membrane repeat protein
MSATDISISLEQTVFQDNTCTGNGEGGAIHKPSTSSDDEVLVKCIGDTDSATPKKTRPWVKYCSCLD